MARVPVVELDELGRVELWAHQLLFHRLLRLAGGVAGEAVVLVVQAGQVALHPGVEDGAGEFVLQEGLDILRLLHLRLDGQVVVVGDLLGDQRGDDLPSDLHQLARRKVRLERPLVGAPLVSRGARGDSCLVLLPVRLRPKNLSEDLAHRRQCLPTEDAGMHAYSPVLQVDRGFGNHRDDGCDRVSDI